MTKLIDGPRHAVFDPFQRRKGRVVGAEDAPVVLDLAPRLFQSTRCGHVGRVAMKMDQVEMPVWLGGQMLRRLSLMQFNDALFNRGSERRIVERSEIAVAQMQFGRLEHGQNFASETSLSGC